MISLNKKMLIVAITAAVTALAQPSFASVFTFASFDYVGPGTVSYNNTTGVLSASNIDIKIRMNSGASGVLGALKHGAAYNTDYDAKLSFTAASLGSAAAYGVIGVQDLALTSCDIELNSALGGKTQFLTGTADIAQLEGRIGGTAGALLTSTGAGATINYTSQFANVPGVITEADLAWAFSSVSPSLTISGANFANFNGIVTGSFGINGTNNAPEPASMALLAGGSIGVAVMGRRRKAKLQA